MSKPLSKPSRHPVRKLVVLLALVGALVALRNATAEKGGSYDPAAPRA